MTENFEIAYILNAKCLNPVALEGVTQTLVQDLPGAGLEKTRSVLIYNGLMGLCMKEAVKAIQRDLTPDELASIDRQVVFFLTNSAMN